MLVFFNYKPIDMSYTVLFKTFNIIIKRKLPHENT